MLSLMTIASLVAVLILVLVCRCHRSTAPGGTMHKGQERFTMHLEVSYLCCFSDKAKYQSRSRREGATNKGGGGGGREDAGSPSLLAQ